MASNTSNAIGTAQQFTRQPAQTHQKQLKGIPLNWNVDTQRNIDDGVIAKGLQSLGVTFSNLGLQHEQNMFNIAEAVSDQVLMNASPEEMRKFKTTELLAKVGEFDTDENPYFVATIDGTRGKETMRFIKNEWDEYKSQHGLGKNVDEELMSYDEFVKEKLEEYGTELNVENKYAFNLGARDEHEKNIFNVAATYSAEKQKLNKIERRENLMAEYETLLEDSDLFTPEGMEAYQKQLQAFILKVKASSTSDMNEEYALKNHIAEMTAEKGVAFLNTLKELDIDGEKFGDVFSLEKYYEVAKAYDVKNKARRIHAYTEELNKCETYETAMDYIDKNVPDEHDREILRGGLDSQFALKANRFAANNSRKIESALSSAKVARSQTIAPQLYEALKFHQQELHDTGIDENGNAYDNITDISTFYTEDAAKKLKLDPKELAQGLLQLMQADVAEGDYRSVVPILKTSLVGKELKNFLKQNYELDVADWRATGNMPESLTLIKGLYDIAPSTVEEVIGQDKADDMLMLDTIIKTHPDHEEAVEVFMRAQEKLSDKALKKDLEDSLLDVDISKSASTPDINYAYEDGANYNGMFSWFVGNKNPSVSLAEPHNRKISKRIDALAVAYRAIGYSPSAAMENAYDEVLSGYCTYANSYIPLDILAPISEDKDRRAKFFGESLAEIQNRESQGRSLLSVEYVKTSSGHVNRNKDMFVLNWVSGKPTLIDAEALIAQAGGRALKAQTGEYELWHWNKGE